MQHVSAFARPQTVPPVPTSVPRQPNWWILSGWRDLLFYVGTPLLLVPMFTMAQSRWSAQDIYLFVSAFGAMGHHLPGMIRAYGDRSLFERFRWRFILAPVFLLAVCCGFYFYDLKGIVLLVFMWGVWHGMMQTYGFCRIYDAKAGSFAAVTRRLDFASCATWFAAAVVNSPSRMTDVLETYYASGAPFIAPAFVYALQRLTMVLAIAVSIAALAHFAWGWVHGKRSNPVKLALLVTSIGFWWYCNNGVTNILAGIALFEVFHDIQYLSLVWIYNRNRVEKDRTIGGFMRFVFRRSGSLVGLYVGLVFAYGSFAYFSNSVEIENLKRILIGVVAASGLLHFYYDGFIWKVREKSTRESLGLAGGGADISLGGLIPGWAKHGAKWALVFCLPLGALMLGQVHSATPELTRNSWVVQDLPGSARAHYNHGVILQKVGKTDEAEAEYRAAVAGNPRDSKSQVNLAGVLMTKGRIDEAKAHFEEALRLEPRNAEVHSGYAYLLERLGQADEATAEYERGIQLDPKSARALYTYGVFLDRRGQNDQAIALYERAIAVDPAFADAHSDLGTALLGKGRFDEARAHFERVVALQPNSADNYSNLGNVYLQQGNASLAIIQYEEALRIDPKFAPALHNLEIARNANNRFRSRARP